MSKVLKKMGLKDAPSEGIPSGKGVPLGKPPRQMAGRQSPQRNA